MPNYVRTKVWFCWSIYGSDKFTVVSYNILGDKNALKHKDMYYNVPSNYMKWERRKRVISEELVSWSPDIVCLQVSFLIFATLLIYFLLSLV